MGRRKSKGRVIGVETTETVIGKIGTIRIGEKRRTKSGKERPAALDYFVFDTKIKAHADYYRSCCGEKPNNLRIIFLSSDPAFSCDDRYELRDKAGKMYMWSNGIVKGAQFQIVRGKEWVDVSPEAIEKRGGIEAFMQTAAAHCESPQGWKRKLTLRFMLLDAPKIAGYFELHTGGASSSIQNLVTAFDFVYKTGGRGVIPFDLSVRIVTSDKRGDKSRYPVLTMTPNRTDDNMQKLLEFTDKADAEKWSSNLLEDGKE